MNARTLIDSPHRARSMLSGGVERLLYFNKTNGQFIAEIRSDLEDSLIQVTGRTPWIFPGMILYAEAEPSAVPSHLHVQNIRIEPPANRRALKKLLTSEAFSEIGPQLAKILAAEHPMDLFQVLEEDPESLRQIAGIGPKKLTQILKSWGDYKARRDFSHFLFSENLPLQWVDLLGPRGAEAFDLFKRQPYAAAEAGGLPFAAVDAYALRNGFALTSPARLRCALVDRLRTEFQQGHCGFPEEQILNEGPIVWEVSREELEAALEEEIIAERIVMEKIRGIACLYLRENWELERHVAQRLMSFRTRAMPWQEIDEEKMIRWAQSILDIQLAPLQKEAIRKALNSPLTVITGGPGTGKTTLIRSLVTVLQTQFTRFALCSPTGRAAQRLGETTGVPARTVHRLLKYDGLTGQFGYNKDKPLEVDLVLVDEASMLDLSLMSALLDALPSHAVLIMVGDADQLPSVGAGCVLQSVLSSPFFEVVRLTDVYRQVSHSLIKENAERINKGLVPQSSANEAGDFKYISVRNVDEARAVVHDLVTRVLPEKCGVRDFTDFQILVPLNRGALGAQELNEDLQKRLGSGGRSFSFETGESVLQFKVGDKVMVTKNDYHKEVFNGDIGFVTRINPEEGFLEAEFQGRPIRFELHELDRLSLAYAITVHKSQGSEYRAVIVVLMNDHRAMAQRHLVYTAVTRAKEHVYLVAQPEALQTALDNTEVRWEKLTEWLGARKGRDQRHNSCTLAPV